MKHVDLLMDRYPQLNDCKIDIENAIKVIADSYHKDGKVLLCGNGGSASDCEHISGEFLKGFLSKRKIKDGEYPNFDEFAREKLQKGIPAIPLTSLTALISAFSNDVDAELVYAQLVFALGKKTDVFVGLSTSGNAKNVSHGAKVAKELGLKTIAMTGKNNSKLSDVCDITIKVPETETFKVQELHLPVYHAICAQVEEDIFGE
ncbi:MAG: SIS domain-containing protein [Clostridiales bacterium]|nr:SIS domain-containing protein [Clostridiales bacterium]